MIVRASLQPIEWKPFKDISRRQIDTSEYRNQRKYFHLIAYPTKFELMAIAGEYDVRNLSRLNHPELLQALEASNIFPSASLKQIYLNHDSNLAFGFNRQCDPIWVAFADVPEGSDCKLSGKFINTPVVKMSLEVTKFYASMKDSLSREKAIKTSPRTMYNIFDFPAEFKLWQDCLISEAQYQAECQFLEIVEGFDHVAKGFIHNSIGAIPEWFKLYRHKITGDWFCYMEYHRTVYDYQWIG